MEVHHHPEFESKSLKQYVLEGVMIFLAVTLGFFAESLRETISEHQHAQKFANTMVADLASDTAELHDYITYYTQAAGGVDTLMKLLGEADPKDIPSGELYFYGLLGGAHRIFIPNDATLVQMKSSGSLRFFAKSDIDQKVAIYDQLCRSLESTDQSEEGLYTEVRKARAKIFAFKYNDSANNIFQANLISYDRQRLDSFMRSNPPLLTFDKVQFNEYIELVRSRFIRRKVAKAITLLKQATDLLSALRQAYDVGK